MSPHEESHRNNFEEHLDCVNNEEYEINVIFELGEECFFLTRPIFGNALIEHYFVKVGSNIHWLVMSKFERVVGFRADHLFVQGQEKAIHNNNQQDHSVKPRVNGHQLDYLVPERIGH